MSRLVLWSVATDWRPGQAIYEVLTWDTEADEYTPQIGMDRWYYGFAGLREAIRLLRRHGYDGAKGDVASSVDRIDQEWIDGDDWGSDVADRRERLALEATTL